MLTDYVGRETEEMWSEISTIVFLVARPKQLPLLPEPSLSTPESAGARSYRTYFGPLRYPTTRLT